MLLTGDTGRDIPGTHDWENILRDLGLLRYDHAIASGADGLCTLLILIAFAWGGYILYRQSTDPSLSE